MNFHSLISLLFILTLATQVLPIPEVNMLMKVKGQVTMIEELNENHSNANTWNEQEHKLMAIPFEHFMIMMSTNPSDLIVYKDYLLKRLKDPFIENLEIPPNLI